MTRKAFECDKICFRTYVKLIRRCHGILVRKPDPKTLNLNNVSYPRLRASFYFKVEGFGFLPNI